MAKKMCFVGERYADILRKTDGRLLRYEVETSRSRTGYGVSECLNCYTQISVLHTLALIQGRKVTFGVLNSVMTNHHQVLTAIR